MITFKSHMYNILLESPQGKIQKYGITDTFYINFIHRYEPLIKWVNIKSKEDLDGAIEYKLKEITKPENYHVPMDGINWKRERLILKAAAIAGNDEAAQSLEHFDSNPEDAKRRILKDINDGKDLIVKGWVKYLYGNDSTFNPAYKFIILNSLLRGATKSRNPPDVLNTNTLARIHTKISEDPKTTFKVNKVYNSFLNQDIMDESETVISGEGTWVRIPGSESDPDNIEKNIKKLMSVSAKNWCICQYSMASKYLDEYGDDFWLYLVDDKKGNKTAVASVRVSDDNIEEISGTEDGGDQNLHDKYLPVVTDLVEKKEFTGKNEYLVELLSKQKKYAKLEKMIADGVINPNDKSSGYNGGGTLLNKALEMGDNKLAEILLDGGADPNIGGSLLWSWPLYTVAENSNVEGFKLLLKHGANINIRNENGDNVLDLILRGRPENISDEHITNIEEMVKLALQAGADPNNKGNNPTNGYYNGLYGSGIIEMGAKFNYKIVKMLLGAGATPTSDALNNAAKYGNIDAVKLLLQAGVDPSESITGAARDNSSEAVKLLLQAGADPNHKVQSSILTVTPLIVATNDYGNKDYVEVVKLLLQAGADPNFSGSGGDEYKPIKKPAYNGNVGMIKELLEAGADPNYGMWNACYKDHAEIINILLQAGADPNTLHSKSPVLFAAVNSRRSVEATNILIHAGADVNYKGGSLDTALHRAVDAMTSHTGSLDVNFDIIKSLLQAGADPNAINGDRWGGTVLGRAIGNMGQNIGNQNNKTEIVNLLLSNGSDPNLSSGSYMDSPLHVAASTGNEDPRNVAVAKLLLKAGADPNAKNTYGKVPIDVVYAHWKGEWEFLQAVTDDQTPKSLEDTYSDTLPTVS